MRFSIRHADKIVGTLVIVALAIIIVVIFMLGSSQRWFTRDYQCKTYFTSASGISLNMPVQYKGFTIGYVKKIGLTENDVVEVIFTIFEEHSHRVKQGSMVEVQASPIGLGNTFIFHPGKGRELLSKEENVIPVIPEIGSDDAKKLAKNDRAEVNESSDKISQIVNQVDDILKTINDAVSGPVGAEESTLEQVLISIEAAAGNINEVAKMLNVQLSPVLQNIDTITNSEGPIYNDLVEVLGSISGILQSMDKAVEYIPAQLPQVALLLSDLHSAIAEAEKLIISLLNNPLFKGGVPQLKETGPGAATPRDYEF